MSKYQDKRKLTLFIRNGGCIGWFSVSVKQKLLTPLNVKAITQKAAKKWLRKFEAYDRVFEVIEIFEETGDDTAIHHFSSYGLDPEEIEPTKA